MAAIWSARRYGQSCLISAAAADTTGVAIDVPLMTAYWLPSQVDGISTPGATRIQAAVSPARLEKEAMRLFASTAPTAMIWPLAQTSFANRAGHSGLAAPVL